MPPAAGCRLARCLLAGGRLCVRLAGQPLPLHGYASGVQPQPPHPPPRSPPLQWFVVGHDCGHRSFCKNKLVEDIVGTLMFMPLIYPFDPWRIKHNQHHAHTNK